jgi:hypothetical protein
MRFVLVQCRGPRVVKIGVEWRATAVTDARTIDMFFCAPDITSARAMVRLLCVTMMNWLSTMNLSSICRKREMFDSSSGASSSSSTQNGLGLTM